MSAKVRESEGVMRFAEEMARLSEEQRLHFYEVLSHNLTVAVRGVWSDGSITDAEKVEHMKWINELLHRVTAKVYVLRLKTHEWTEEDFGRLIRETVESCQGILDAVFWAVQHTYRNITGAEMD